MNVKIRVLSETIAKLLNESDLPVEVKRLVVKDIFNQLEIASMAAIKKQIEEDENGIQ